MGVIQNLLLNELEAKGYQFDDVTHLKNQNDPLPLEATEIILKWLPKVYDEHLGAGECLVRSLISASEPYDPSVLINLFENRHHNKSIKWAIAYVISISETHNITSWLKNQLFAQPHAFERAGFLEGLVRKGGFQSKDELRAFLKEIFDKYAYYGRFQKLFQKFGSIEDVVFLKEKAIRMENKRTAKEILKIADKLKNRKREAKFP